MNDKERALYRAACKYESDRISMINESERKGIARGIQQGIQQGFADGAYQTKLETAKILKKLHCDMSIILQSTGLSTEEIERL